eukprot:jgi/Tetstr1/463506/TSEL_008386.t1
MGCGASSPAGGGAAPASEPGVSAVVSGELAAGCKRDTRAGLARPGSDFDLPPAEPDMHAEEQRAPTLRWEHESAPGVRQRSEEEQRQAGDAVGEPGGAVDGRTARQRSGFQGGEPQPRGSDGGDAAAAAPSSGALESETEPEAAAPRAAAPAGRRPQAAGPQLPWEEAVQQLSFPGVDVQEVEFLKYHLQADSRRVAAAVAMAREQSAQQSAAEADTKAQGRSVEAGRSGSRGGSRGSARGSLGMGRLSSVKSLLGAAWGRTSDGATSDGAKEAQSAEAASPWGEIRKGKIRALGAASRFHHQLDDDSGDGEVEVPVEARGVTVRWLARFYNYCRHRLDDPAGDDFSTAALVAGLVGPQTARRGCAFALMTGVDRKPPDVVVVHAWERPFGELVHSLKSRFAHARDTAVWIDVFALLQWPHAPPEQSPSALAHPSAATRRHSTAAGDVLPPARAAANLRKIASVQLPLAPGGQRGSGETDGAVMARVFEQLRRESSATGAGPLGEAVEMTQVEAFCKPADQEVNGDPLGKAPLRQAADTLQLEDWSSDDSGSEEEAGVLLLSPPPLAPRPGSRQYAARATRGADEALGAAEDRFAGRRLSFGPSTRSSVRASLRRVPSRGPAVLPTALAAGAALGRSGSRGPRPPPEEAAPGPGLQSLPSFARLADVAPPDGAQGEAPPRRVGAALPPPPRPGGLVPPPLQGLGEEAECTGSPGSHTDDSAYEAGHRLGRRLPKTVEGDEEAEALQLLEDSAGSAEDQEAALGALAGLRAALGVTERTLLVLDPAGGVLRCGWAALQCFLSAGGARHVVAATRLEPLPFLLTRACVAELGPCLAAAGLTAAATRPSAAQRALLGERQGGGVLRSLLPRLGVSAGGFDAHLRAGLCLALPAGTAAAIGSAYGDGSEEAARVGALVGRLLARAGHGAAGRAMLSGAVDVLVGASSPEAALAMHDLAALLRGGGDHASAALLYGRVVAVAAAAFGERSRQAADALQNLADAAEAAGQYGGAEDALRRLMGVLAALRAPLSAQLPVMYSLARVLTARGDASGAETLLVQAVALVESVPSADRRELVAALVAAGDGQRKGGQLARAESTLRRAVAIEEGLRAGGKPTADGLAGLTALGRALKAGGKLGEAEAVYVRVEALQAAAGVPREHAMTAAARMARASLARARGDLAAAVPLYREAVAILEGLPGGARGGELAAALNNLGTALSAAGRPGEAAPVLERALEMMEGARGGGSGHAAAVAAHLGAAYLAMGDGAAASLVFTRVAELKARALGEGHPEVAAALTALARAAALDPASRLDRRALLKRAAAILLAAHGLESAEALEAMELLAAAEEAAGDSAAAAVVLAQVARTLAATLPADGDSERLAGALLALGRTRLAAGDGNGAVAALREAMAVGQDSRALGEAGQLLSRALGAAGHA